jgi:hypothetical protein
MTAPHRCLVRNGHPDPAYRIPATHDRPPFAPSTHAPPVVLDVLHAGDPDKLVRAMTGCPDDAPANVPLAGS